MLQRDRSGPQIRDKDSNPNQRKHVSKHIWNVVMASKITKIGEVVGESGSGI